MESVFRYVLKQFLDQYFTGLDGKIDYSRSAVNVKEGLHLRDELMQHLRENNESPFELQDCKIGSLSVHMTELGKLQVVASNLVLDFNLVPVKALGRAWVAGQEAQAAAAPGFAHEVLESENKGNGGYWSALFQDKPLPRPVELTANYCLAHVNPASRRRGSVRITDCKVCEEKVQTNFKCLTVCMCCSLKFGRCLHCGSGDVPFRVPAYEALPILEAERHRRRRSKLPVAEKPDLEAVIDAAVERAMEAELVHAPSKRPPPSLSLPPFGVPEGMRPCGDTGGDTADGAVLEDDEMDDGFPAVQASANCRQGSGTENPRSHARPHPPLRQPAWLQSRTGRGAPSRARDHDGPLQPPQSQSGPLLGAGYVPPSPIDYEFELEKPPSRERSPPRPPRGIARSSSNLGWDVEPDHTAHVHASERASWPVTPPSSARSRATTPPADQWETPSFETALPLPMPPPGGFDQRAAVSPKSSRSPGRASKKLSRSPSGRPRSAEILVKNSKGCKAWTSG